jgi:DSF synthase
MAIPASNLFNLPQYPQLLTHYDPEKKVVWHYVHPGPRPCFTTEVLREMYDVQSQVLQYREQSPEAADHIRYLVLASAIPSVFSLGGDLDLFARLIVNRDRDGLRAYAHLCVDCVYGYASHLGQPGVTTISLVQGKALGGGFEAALSCNVLIAERGAQFGFPEILFNLFPGMGAYSFLIRRIDPIRVERFLRQGDQYSAETLYEMGVVDVLAEDGEGTHAVYDFIRRHERACNGMEAIQRLHEWNRPLTREELIRIADMWVDNALQVTPRDLRTMARLTAAQGRLPMSGPAPLTEPLPSRVVPFPSNIRELAEAEELPGAEAIA